MNGMNNLDQSDDNSSNISSTSEPDKTPPESLADDDMEIEKEDMTLDDEFSNLTEDYEIQPLEVRAKMPIDDNPDPYKAEATIAWEFSQFSEWARMVRQPYERKAYSPYVYIRGLKFRILAKISYIPESSYLPRKCLGLFLEAQCDKHIWSIRTDFKLIILGDSKSIVNSASKDLNNQECDWGYNKITTIDVLLNPANGYIKNDTITILAEIWADAPGYDLWNSKARTGHIGLTNQGATCYMNSILQMLFFTNSLRKAVYLIPTENDSENSVALAMQRVFYQLQFSDSPVETKKLTKSFGWNTWESFLQHDVQELCRVLLDNLESKMKNTSVADTIPNLFRGCMKSYIKCKNVDFESSRIEDFYDIQLNVKGLSNLIESFRDYTKVEVLDDDNKYDAGEHGLQEAEKGVKFVSFPPVLHLHLMRFQYNPIIDHNMKINDRFEFSQTLVLNEFIDEKEGQKDDYTYVLHSVLVHMGTPKSGHYVVYINTDTSGDPLSDENTDNYNTTTWCKFNDEFVSKATIGDAIHRNFGGADKFSFRTPHFASAYMLVYVKKSQIDVILSPVTSDDIPQHLKSRFEMEKTQDEIDRRKKEEEAKYMEITLITDEIMRNHEGFDLFTYRDGVQIKIEKEMTGKAMYEFVARNLAIEKESLRLWFMGNSTRKFQHHDSQVMDAFRPTHKIDPDHEASMERLTTASSSTMMFIELDKSDSDSPGRLPEITPNSRLCFLKYYNHSRFRPEYKGYIHLTTEELVRLEGCNKSPRICRKLGLPEDSNLNISIEVDPLHHCHTNDFKILAGNQGNILIIEEAGKVSKAFNSVKYFEKLLSKINVEFVEIDDGFVSKEKANPAFRADIDGEKDLTHIVEVIGTAINYDPKKILLWKTENGRLSRPICRHYDGANNDWVLDSPCKKNGFHTDPRTNEDNKVYYSLLPILQSALFDNDLQIVRVTVMNQKFQFLEIAIYPKKRGTIGDLIDEVTKANPFQSTLIGQFRCVYLAKHRIHKTISHLNPWLDEFNYFHGAFRYGMFTIDPDDVRIEEVPFDQNEFGEDEVLIPVAHYDKDPSRLFGIPFLLKISFNETAKYLYHRVLSVLDVPESDYKKYKLTIIKDNEIVHQLDPDGESLVHFYQFYNKEPNDYDLRMPFIGIDHVNRSRPTKIEKSIVIHN